MFNAIFNTISNWVEALINLVVSILNTIIRWIDDIIDWAIKMVKGIRTRIVFIMTMKELMEKLKKLFQNETGGTIKPSNFFDIPEIPTVHVSNLYGDDKKFEDGLVELIHDTETDKIVDIRLVGGEGIDDDLRKVMKDTNIIQLG